MFARDRWFGTALLLAATGVWVGVAWLVTARSPVGDPLVLFAGALAMGAGVSFTAWPLLWLLEFAAGRRVAYRGGWARAGRRAGLAGLTVAVLIVLRGEGSLSLPLAVFVVALALLVEGAFMLRR
jgi:hypothetical protein